MHDSACWRITWCAQLKPVRCGTPKWNLWSCSYGTFIRLLHALALRRGVRTGTAIVSGRVLQVADGAPLAFASVIVELASSGQSLSARSPPRTAASGWSAPGEYRITITFPGFQPAMADVLVSPLNQS